MSRRARRSHMSIRVMRLVSVLALVVPATGLAARPGLAATTRHVSTTGADTGDCTVNPCKTVGSAISQSTSDDTVQIAAGTYHERIAVDRSLTLQGAGARTII